MKLYSWNINGIRSILKKDFKSWLENNPADIYCLQEVRALKEQIPAEIYEHKGYHCFWNPAEKKGYSGVALWSKSKPLKVHYGLGNPKFDLEGRTIVAEFKNFVLYNIYFPNGASKPERLDYKMEFYQEFLKHAQAQVKPVIVCGDFNTCHQEIDIARPKANEKRSGFLPIERDWMDSLIQADYIDSYRQFNPSKVDVYTWWSNRGGARQRNVGWRIDYFFLEQSLKDNLKKAEVHMEDLGSDHCPISIEISF
jgi:exodeoxyribonuclease-3